MQCPPGEGHCPETMYEPASHQVGWICHSSCELQSVQHIMIILPVWKAKPVCTEIPEGPVHGHPAKVKDPLFPIALMIVRDNIRHQSNRGKAVLLTML